MVLYRTQERAVGTPTSTERIHEKPFMGQHPPGTCPRGIYESPLPKYEDDGRPFRTEPPFEVEEWCDTVQDPEGG